MAVAATFTKSTHGRQRVGRQTHVSGEIDPVGTYATGGFAVTPGLFGLSRLDDVRIHDAPNNGTEFMVANYIAASNLIKLGWTGGATGSELDEITNSDTCTGFVFNVTAVGA